VVTYRLRVELNEADPPTWRRLEVHSNLNLAELHDVLQVVFGWTDSHLHGFVAGPEFYHGGGERYLCPFDEEEENYDGVPEAQVRLDEVLAEPGDTLSYAYDYGDNWQKLITLETVLPRDENAPRAACTDGERDGPAEDCGGVHCYELIAAATDPTRPDHVAAKREFAAVFGDEISPGDFETTRLDLGEVNASLKQLGPNPHVDVDRLPVPLSELIRTVRSTDGLRTLRQLITAAKLDDPIEVAAETAREMVRPYAWLLDRVGASGIKLTSAGYLPPVHVSAAFNELGLADEWIGAGNRELDTLPVLDLRESAQKLGLLRKYRGELRCTSRGQALRDNPVGLWWHLAERMPLGSSDPFMTQGGLLYLIAVAANEVEEVDDKVVRVLAAVGWRRSDGTPFTSQEAFTAWRDTEHVLTRIGAVVRGRGWEPQKATPAGLLFARAALRTWPK
jgi:hypothetical protein